MNESGVDLGISKTDSIVNHLELNLTNLLFLPNNFGRLSDILLNDFKG